MNTNRRDFFKTVGALAAYVAVGGSVSRLTWGDVDLSFTTSPDDAHRLGDLQLSWSAVRDADLAGYGVHYVMSDGRVIPVKEAAESTHPPSLDDALPVAEIRVQRVYI